MSKWSATMPANIALIKYMGKQPGQIPSNASLSVTVPRLTSTVTLAEAQQDHWKPTHWSLSAQNRFLSHLNYLKSTTQTHQCFSIQSENNFPDTCGLASSASSFAALTHAFFLAVAPETPLSIQASHSRMGSGSSCRSFFAPLVSWTGTEVQRIPNNHSWHHNVIIINASEKKIPSSEAHQRVMSSPAFKGRTQRAEARMQTLLTALAEDDWQQAYHLCWDEFQDMHHLFHSAEPPFKYIEKATERALSQLQTFWQSTGTGPIITLDAGPNIHLFFKDIDTQKQCLKQLSNHTIL